MTERVDTYSVGHEGGQGRLDLNGKIYTVTRQQAHRLAQSLLTLGNNMIKLEEREPEKLPLNKRVRGMAQGLRRTWQARRK